MQADGEVRSAWASITTFDKQITPATTRRNSKPVLASTPMNTRAGSIDKLAFAAVVVIAIVVGAITRSVVVGVAVLAVANMLLGAALLLRARRAGKLGD